MDHIYYLSACVPIATTSEPVPCKLALTQLTRVIVMTLRPKAKGMACDLGMSTHQTPIINMFILRSRASSPPRTPSRRTSTRPVTPVLQSRPTTPLQRRPTKQLSPTSSSLDNLPSNDPTTSPPLQKVKDEPGCETARIRAQLIENHFASTEAESRRPDYFKRTRRLAPSSSAGASGASLTSDLGGRDGSLLWSSANVGVIESPVKGKRIALFQETSEESFEESLMAGGYGRYVS